MLIKFIIIYCIYILNLYSSSFDKSKFFNLDITSRHYISFEYVKKNNINYNKFTSRRNYLTFKSFLDNHKSYIRFTIDSYLIDDNKDYSKDIYGSWNMRVKYAFLYLDNILPYTSLKMGQVHRPWLNFEGKNSWFHRAVSKNLIDNSDSIKFTNSSDFGINFKTKLKNFSSELGIFNGEGYHGIQNNSNLSYEWRFTAHILGRGDEKIKISNQFAHISFFGQLNNKSENHNNKDLYWSGLHFVYNQKELLISSQFIKSYRSDKKYKGLGFSINGDYRINNIISIFSRYNYFEFEENNQNKKLYIMGVDYKYNKNIIFIVNWSKNKGTKLLDNDKYSKIFLTAHIKW